MIALYLFLFSKLFKYRELFDLVLKQRCRPLAKSRDKPNEKKGIVGKAWEIQHNLEARQKRIGKGKYGRVMKMARNPTNEEFSKTSKITGLGIILIGAIGFLIFLLSTQVAPWIAEMLGLM